MKSHNNGAYNYRAFELRQPGDTLKNEIIFDLVKKNGKIRLFCEPDTEPVAERKGGLLMEKLFRNEHGWAREFICGKSAGEGLKTLDVYG